MLNSDTSYEKLAGVNLLEQIGLASREDNQLVVEALTGYLRHKYPVVKHSAWEDPLARPFPGPEVSRVLATISVLTLNRPTGDERLVNYGKSVRLNQTNLQRVTLADADLRESLLTYIDLGGAHILAVVFDKANMKKACLVKSNITLASMRGVSLEGASLQGAMLRGVDLCGAKLKGALLHRADLRETRGLTDLQLNGAHGDSSTLLPPGLNRPAHWIDSPTIPEEDPTSPDPGAIQDN